MEGIQINFMRAVSFNGEHIKGFTIVELLIVIVVIGVLAGISIVAYTGVQGRAQDTALQSDANTIKKALELFFIDNNSYPICGGGSGHSCTLASIKPQLVPTYVNDLPDNSTYPNQYVATTADTHGNRWSVRMFKKSSSTYCQIGINYYTTWWSSSPAC